MSPESTGRTQASESVPVPGPRSERRLHAISHTRSVSRASDSPRPVTINI